MKSGVRMFAVASGPLGSKSALLVGIVSRGGITEGVVSSSATVDGADATVRIASMLSRSRFKSQVKLIALNGIGIAGLNIVDTDALAHATGTAVMSVTRGRPHPNELIKALKALSRDKKIDVADRIALVEKAKGMGIFGAGGMYAQTRLSRADASSFMHDAAANLRLAHMIARGVSSGESKGRI